MSGLVNRFVDFVNYSANAGPSGNQLYLYSDYGRPGEGPFNLGSGPESIVTALDTVCGVWTPSSNCPSGTVISNTQYIPQNPPTGFFGTFISPSGPVITQ